MKLPPLPGTRRLPPIPAALQAAARRSIALAADWAVRNQITDSWPAWNANKGRLPYHAYIDPARRARHPQMWSTCWKTARAAQGLYCAHRITGRAEHLQAAERALDYVATLQIFDPECPDFRGSFREDSPQGPHIASRDGVEAVQGFIAGHLASGGTRHLLRASEGADFLLRAEKKGWWPFGVAWPHQERVKPQDAFCFAVGALIFAQLHALTGRSAYRARALAWTDDALAKHVRADGAVGAEQLSGDPIHGVSQGPYAGVYVNDDGVGVTLLSAYAIGRQRRHLDAAVRWADWWLRVAGPPPKLAAHPAALLFLSDVYRLTGDARYLAKIEELAQATLALQCRARDPLLHGAFIGEDMAQVYDKRSKPEDYVDLRITSYALIALAKLAARTPAQWGCAYSCYGW